MSLFTASKIIKVNVTDNNLTALVALNGDVVTETLTAEQITTEVGDLGIVIDEAGAKNIEHLAKIMAEERVPEAMVVARGTAPVSDENGRLEKLFDDPKDKHGQDNEGTSPSAEEAESQKEPTGGRQSHYERSSIVTVQADQKFIRVVPPMPGADGVDVYGKAIPRKLGREASFRLGPNVKRHDDHLVATCAGQLEIVGEKISVSAKLEIQGNVDFAVGNIDFPGEVIIAKNVLDLFKVRSDSSIIVKGLIEAAEVHAGGDLYGTGGMTGKEKGVFSAGNDIHTKYITNAKVRAGNDVSAQTEVVNCDLVCGGVITIENGVLVGGRVSAVGGANLKDLGSEAEVKTFLEVGVDRELRDKFDQHAPEIEKRRLQAKKVRQIVEPLLANKKHLNAEQKEKAAELLYTSYELEDGAEEMITELRQAYEAYLERDLPAIIVSGAVFPGVTVCFPKMQALITTALHGPLKIMTQKVKNDLRIVAFNSSTGSSHDLKASPHDGEFWEVLEELLRPPKQQEEA